MKRIAMFLLVIVAVSSFAASVSARGFDGGLVYDGGKVVKSK